jgi:hypothetical protein
MFPEDYRFDRLGSSGESHPRRSNPKPKTVRLSSESEWMPTELYLWTSHL